MDKREALYPKLQGQVERAKKKLKEAKIPEINKQYVLDFLVKLEADGTSNAQILSYLDRLTPILKIIGSIDLKDLTKKDMEDVFAKYRRGYSPSSLNKAIQCLKCFFRWLYDLSSSDPAPEQVRWMKKESCPSKLRPEDLWTEEDVEKAMKVARSLRDKCMLSVLYETGLRPGEMRGLKIRDVVTNGDMIRLYVSGKTERKTGERVVPVLRSYNLLKMWLAQHPKREDPNAWLWTSNGKPFKDVTFRFLFRSLAKKAKINKPSHPYILRHTALTRFYKKIPGVANELAGHVMGSTEAQRYCHLAAEDLEEAVRDMNCVSRKQKEETVIKCHKCGQTLNIGDRICPVCGLAQDNETALKRIEDVEEALNIRAGLAVLGKKYPELGKLVNKLLIKENFRHLE